MLDRTTFLRPIAHRGLHDAARGIIENTAPAFEAAIAKGYGIECDLQPAADGTPLVFHDLELGRLTTGSGLITGLQPGCAAKLPFRGTDLTGILSFADLLALIGGRVPLLAEIKSEWNEPNPAFMVKISNLATAYAGPLALMSFDPAVMATIRRLAPGVPRGIVTGSYRYPDGTPWYPDQLSDARRDALANLKESGPADPYFYAYDVRALPSPVAQRIRDDLRLPLFTWTVRTEAQRETARLHADAQIFEGYEA
ncbi:glycerophosphodiester phosphodiesterase family protein [Hyphomicrobium sp.]|uniref:glycerophosphodiester phosphodiesterase family protein n=1 Tax=Hyphomicrobium sp. TaxID=82 RepID=UPI002E357500|nr:glycerophosphodiester phosphodiesterase family protein [Hyphomicrobium sp.]HEX2842760.1 glycerophosphodiester phosphodiesterase family protein [Hyphomicrobium sp.]